MKYGPRAEVTEASRSSGQHRNADLAKNSMPQQCTTGLAWGTAV